MGIARHKCLLAGVMLGAIAVALTYAMERFTFVAPNLLVRGLQSIAFTLVLPGFIVSIASSRALHGFHTGLAAACNFVFWLGFGGLFLFLLDKLRQQIRILASHL